MPRNLLVVIFVSLFTMPLAGGDDKIDLIRVGVIHSLFDGKDDQAVFSQMQPFAELIRGRTGLNGEFIVIRGADTMGKDLAAGRVGLGVLHGLEYGWLKQQCPDCKPLLAAVNETTRIKAVVLVRKSDPAKTPADLKGQTLALPSRSLMHTRLYLERSVNVSLGEFFKVVEMANMDAAIDAVVDGQARLSVIGNVALEAYRERKPGRFNRLRVLVESPPFPPAVVVYRPTGKVRQDILAKFRDSLLKAHTTTEGRQTLTLWRLTEFQEVPEDFEQIVESAVKAFPPR